MSADGSADGAEVMRARIKMSQDNAALFSSVCFIRRRRFGLDWLGDGQERWS